MTENDDSVTRWYDEDEIVSKCVNLLQNLKNSDKRQTATFLMNEIITIPPFVDMLPDEVLNVINSEERRRRWYDFDETVRIFAELLRYSTPDARKKIATRALTFIEDMISSK